MSKFNLDAAKRGDAVQVQISGIWKDCYFIGVNKRGDIVLVEVNGIVYHKSYESSNLRMKPNKRKMYTYPYKLTDSTVLMMIPDYLKSNLEYLRSKDKFACGEVQMILVDEE